MAEAKKSRKHGRNKVQCASYRSSQRREFNKARRLIKLLRTHPADVTAWDALKNLDNKLFSAQRKTLGIAAVLAGRGDGHLPRPTGVVIPWADSLDWKIAA